MNRPPCRRSVRLKGHGRLDQHQLQTQPLHAAGPWPGLHLTDFSISPVFDYFPAPSEAVASHEHGVAGAPLAFGRPTHRLTEESTDQNPSSDGRPGPTAVAKANLGGELGNAELWRQCYQTGQLGLSAPASPKDVSRLMSASLVSMASQEEHGLVWEPEGAPGEDGAVINGGTPPRGPDEDDEDDEPKPPAWSRLKTKAGKQRRRLPLACFACRQKKVRCSGEKPTCKHCLRWRISCVYKTKPRRAAPRKTSEEPSDGGLKQIETSTAEEETRSMMASDGAAVTSTSTSRRPSLSLKGPARRKRSAHEACDTEEEQWTGDSSFLAVQDETQPATGRAQLSGPTDSMPSEGADCMSSAGVQGHLSGVPFDFVNGSSYPVLQSPSFSAGSRYAWLTA